MTFDKRYVRAIVSKYAIICTKKNVQAVYFCSVDDLINSVYYIIELSELENQYKLTKYAAYNYTKERYFDSLHDLKVFIDKGLHLML